MSDVATEQVSQPKGPELAGRSFSLSGSAAKRIAKLRDLEGKPGLMMRVSVTGGGCSGFQYIFDFDETINDDDHVFENGDVSVLVDDVSLDLVNGAELNYKEDLVGSYFEVNNPNADSACGCGTSFSIS